MDSISPRADNIERIRHGEGSKDRFRWSDGVVDSGGGAAMAVLECLASASSSARLVGVVAGSWPFDLAFEASFVKISECPDSR